MREVQPRRGQFRKRQVARDHHVLRGRRDARQAELGGHEPFVHAAPLGKMQILAVIDHRQIERQGILHRAAHDQAVHHGLPVI